MTYCWMSIKTGEVVSSLRQAMRVALVDWRKYHIVNILWVYRKEGWA